MTDPTSKPPISRRFRGFLPVVVDVETGGFDAKTDALLEIAAVIIDMDESGLLYSARTISHHIEPFPGSKMEPASMAVNGIDPYHPFRLAVSETEALQNVFREVRRSIKSSGCSRAVLVGHNAFFDLNFLNAAVSRNSLKRNPFHPFSNFDTVSLAGLAFGETVLAKAAVAAGIDWDTGEAHSAVYDAERTAELFCRIVNRWQELGGWLMDDASVPH